MKKRIIALILLLSISLSSFFSCSPKEKYVDEQFDYFDTYCSLTVYADKQDFIFYSTEFESILQEYHKLFDIYNSYDGIINLKYLNDNAWYAPLAVSKELFDALALAKELYSVTNGKFNPAIGALTSIWHEARETSNSNPENAYIPSQYAIDHAIQYSNISFLLLNEELQTVYLIGKNSSLDLGAMAKGYVASVIYQRLIELGCDNFLINLGGNVLSHGKKTQNEPWLIKIENPFEDKSLGYNDTIKLNEMTVVTSGSYQRYFTYKEKEYSHIIDPSSGYPSDRFTSVSVQANSDSSALAEALSTALFCMSFEEGYALIEKLEDVEALWIFNDGSYKSTSNFGGAK